MNDNDRGSSLTIVRLFLGEMISSSSQLLPINLARVSQRTASCSPGLVKFCKKWRKKDNKRDKNCHTKHMLCSFGTVTLSKLNTSQIDRGNIGCFQIKQFYGQPERNCQHGSFQATAFKRRSITCSSEASIGTE